MTDQIQTIGMLLVKGVVLPIIGMMLAWASTHIPAWLAAHVKNKQAEGVLDRLTQLAFHVVQEVEQTTVSGLGDKLDAAALKAARDQALETLKSHLGDQGLKELENVFGLSGQDAVIKMLITFIESSVHSMNAAKKAA